MALFLKIILAVVLFIILIGPVAIIGAFIWLFNSIDPEDIGKLEEE